MLKLKVRLEQAIEPLVYESLKVQLNSFAEEHPREADRNCITSMMFRRAVAGQAAEYFAQKKGAGHWRGVINQDTAKQLMIEVTRAKSYYRGYAKLTSIQTEDITRLTKQPRSTTHP
jgi:hypothetical protein